MEKKEALQRKQWPLPGGTQALISLFMPNL
jgi:hypothetical protein